MARSAGAVVIGPGPWTIVTMKRVINKVSHATVGETVARLIAKVGAGLRLSTTIDHSRQARASGLELPGPTKG